MNKKSIENLVRVSICSKLIENSLFNKWAQESNAPVVLGQGDLNGFSNINGNEFAKLILRPIPEDAVFNAIKTTLTDLKFDPKAKYSPEQTQYFQDAVKNTLKSEFSQYLKYLNPQLGNVKL